MTYEIRANGTFGSNEVYFDSKPADAVREALKALRFRWNGVKKCWYGFAKESEIIAAIIPNMQEDGVVVTDGYMGGGAVYGKKSGMHLHGADLSKAIREDIKAAGIKGVTVSCKTYTGGQSITATVKASADMFVSLEEFTASYRIKGGTYWIYTGEGPAIFHEVYWAASAEEQEQIRKAAAAYEYNRCTQEKNTLHSFSSERCAYLTAEAMEKVAKVDNIISSYRYDESNSMVDYFNTNFYYDIDIKPA